jgi:transposase InsO family protein
MAALLGVSRSGYYAWAARQQRAPGPRAARRAELLDKITAAHRASDGVNGSPRILEDLREAGETVSRKTVAKIMRNNDIRGISPRPWHPVTTIGDDAVHNIPDLVGRRFDRGVLNQVWTSDITYLATGQGWLYLCAVRDGCSRRVLGYAFADTLHTDVVEAAVHRAVMFRDPDTGWVLDGRDQLADEQKVIFHADRGCQGGFNRSSQHLDGGGAGWRVRGNPGRRLRLGLGGSGLRIGRCGRRCGRRVGRSPRVRCSASSGV